MIKYRGGYKYQLAEDYSISVGIRPANDINTTFITLTEGGRLTVKAGYAWDGPSGPAIDCKTNMRGSLAHDAIYQMMREGFLLRENREKADILYRNICKEDGMPSIQAWWHYQGVRKFAASAAHPKNRKPILTAP